MHELKIALKQVSSRRRQTFFAILAIVLAVAVITVMMAMLMGFQTELIRASIENNPNIVINPQNEKEEFIHLYWYNSAQIAGKKGVVAVSPNIWARQRWNAGIILKEFLFRGLNLRLKISF